METFRIWLDDLRPAPSGWLWVKTADECIAALKRASVTEAFVEVSLDHDLADEHLIDARSDYMSGGYMPHTYREKTGYHVVLWMAENDVWPDRIHLHTANPVGRDAMRACILRHRPNRLGLVISYTEAYAELMTR